MCRRVAALMIVLVGAGRAHAHRLEAQAFLRPFGFVQIESWFEGGEVPRAAKVEVFGPDGKLLTEGRLDAQGVFIFACSAEGPLRVVVNAGGGHAATVQIKPEDLARAAAETRALRAWIACITPVPAPLVAAPLLLEVQAAPPAPEPAAPPSRGTQWGKVAIGIGALFLIAGAAAARRWARRRSASVGA